MAPLINFSGLASGIDSSSLIQALLDQQRALRITPLEDKITSLQDTNSALDELSTLISNLSTAASRFRTVNGGAVSKQAGSSDEGIVTASAGNGAQAGSYDLTVTSLASTATFSFNDRFASTSTVIDATINNGAAAANRTVSFTIGTGTDSEDVDIVLTNTSTATDFVTAFNSQSTKASASLVNMGTASSPSYAIVITSDEAGTEDGTITLNSVGAEVAPAFAANTLDQAEDAVFSVDGISGTITRSSNSISDVIPGLTFNLESAGDATITISNDTDATQQLVQDFVDAYNSLVEFIRENDAVTSQQNGSETENIFGALAETSVDDGVLTAIRSAFSSSALSGGTVNILADLGITTNRDGTLNFDTEDFQDALASAPDEVEDLLGNLGETLASVNGTLAQYTQFNGLVDQVLNSNNSQISSYQKRIEDAESSLDRQQESLLAQFGRLEAMIGQLNSQQSALAALLPTG